jgi:hypothetical protein
MKHALVSTLRLVTAASLALSLSGCFNNMSGLDDSGTTRSAQTATLNDSGFANETGPIDTSAILIGAYKDTTTPTDYGALIDLQKSLTATLGAAALQSILDTIDTNTAMQARQLTIHIPDFQTKAVTTLGAVAAGNGKKLRNIMNIRPRLARIDLTTSALEVPAAPSTLQLKNANKTIITYGGKIEGDYVRRMTTMITYAGANGSYLPSIAIPTWGDGYPAASPDETVGSIKLYPVSIAIATAYANLMKAPQDASRFSTAPDSVKAITQTYGQMALAVHFKVNALGVIQSELNGNPLIDAAYFVNINPAVTSGPEIFPFCHSGYNEQDLAIPFGDPAAGTEVDYTHPLACNCDSTKGSCQGQVLPAPAPSNPPTPLPGASVYTETYSSDATQQKAGMIRTLMNTAAYAPPILPSIFTIGPPPATKVVNGFTLSNE